MDEAHHQLMQRWVHILLLMLAAFGLSACSNADATVELPLSTTQPTFLLFFSDP